ncbi:MAG: phosphoribosylglycinamide formyltransferase 1 [uncultured Candidatus Poseidoniales archaeon]|nr:MAG: phosphoribosylglycinamide formyltransferase 1 [uncultured Candidatus Poseidoniales archaeon]
MGGAPSEQRPSTAGKPVRCAILISGSGSGMEAMIHHQQSNPGCGHETVLVIADRPDAKGLERASSLGIESRCIPLPSDHEDPTNRRVAHEKIVHEHLLAANVDLVLLSGYMRLLTPYLVGPQVFVGVNRRPIYSTSTPLFFRHSLVLTHTAMRLLQV